MSLKQCPRKPQRSVLPSIYVSVQYTSWSIKASWNGSTNAVFNSYQPSFFGSLYGNQQRNPQHIIMSTSTWHWVLSAWLFSGKQYKNKRWFWHIQKPKQYCYACNNYHGAEVDGCKVKLHRFSLQQEAGKCLETRNPIRWQTQHVELWYPLALKALVSSFVPGSANTVLAVRQLFSSQYSLSSYTFRAEIYHFSAIFH